MTKPLRHTTREINARTAAAARHGMGVRLERDGSITLIPANHSLQTKQVDHGIRLPAATTLDGWLKGQADEGTGNGRS